MEGDTPQLCDDLRNIREGDSVTLTTTEDEFYAECTGYDKFNEDDPEVVREYTTLTFDQDGVELTVQITDGLRRFEWEAEYPRHTPLYDTENEVGLGHVTAVKIHGKIEA